MKMGTGRPSMCRRFCGATKAKTKGHKGYKGHKGHKGHKRDKGDKGEAQLGSDQVRSPAESGSAHAEACGNNVLCRLCEIVGSAALLRCPCGTDAAVPTFATATVVRR